MSRAEGSPNRCKAASTWYETEAQVIRIIWKRPQNLPWRKISHRKPQHSTNKVHRKWL